MMYVCKNPPGGTKPLSAHRLIGEQGKDATKPRALELLGRSVETYDIQEI